ncbi:hypothetical protein [Phormidesmis priestleyi]
MLEVHKRYILDENQQPIAVQISIDQFEQIEEILESSGQVILTTESQSSSFNRPFEETLGDCELEDLDGILVVKAQGAKIPLTIVDDLREERIREMGGW